MLNYCEAVAVSDMLQEVTMKSVSKIFRRSTGLEEVCSRVNDFVTDLGGDRVISISTMVESASSQKNMGGITVDTSPIEYIVIVWYWEAEEATLGK